MSSHLHHHHLMVESNSNHLTNSTNENNGCGGNGQTNVSGRHLTLTLNASQSTHDSHQTNTATMHVMHQSSAISHQQSPLNPQTPTASVGTLISNETPIDSNSETHILSGAIDSHQHNHQQRTLTETDHFRSIMDQQASQSLMQQSNQNQVMLALADHVDDDNDLFECGKCRQHFTLLLNFLQHKKVCNNRKNEKLRNEIAEIELHLGIPSQHHLIHSSSSHHSIGKTLLSSSANSSPLLIQSTNNSPTSMLNVGQNNQLSVDILGHRSHHIHNHLHQQSQSRQSPLNVDALNGASLNVNSILPDSDLLSLTSSLDANMIASIGNSISPSSLLHLQGGDVSSNTDDFAQFVHIDPSTDVSLSDVQQIQPRTVSNVSLFTGVSNNGSILNSIVSSSNSVTTTPMSAINQQQPTLISFMNSIHTSPTSFAPFIQNISTNDAIGSDSTLLKSPFDGDVESASNDNSIGSPSRFLNLPPTSTTPSSIIEHRPNQSCQSVRSTQTSISTNSSENSQTSQSKGVISNVIYHHSRQQSLVQEQNSLTIDESLKKPIIMNGSLPSRTESENPHKPLSTDEKQQQQQLKNIAISIDPFKCNYCDRSYTKSSELASHIPCHTGEKPFQCCVCGKAFGQKNNLRKHILTHKMPKEEHQKAYRTSLDESMKNIPPKSNNTPSVTTSQSLTQAYKTLPESNKVSTSNSMDQTGIVSSSATSRAIKNDTNSTMELSSQQQPIRLNPSETFVYICPLKCGYTSDHLESIRIHCNTQHQNQFADVTLVASNNNQSAQPMIVCGTQEISQQQVDSKTPLNVSTSNKNENVELTSIKSIDQSLEKEKNTAVNSNDIIKPKLNFKIQDKFTCPVPDCGFTSTRETEFKMHCVDHTVADDENTRYQCTDEDCKEVYNNVEAYIKHLQSHDRAICNSGETESHGATESKAKPRTYRCQTCLNRYTTQNALENHKATSSHHFPCPNCKKVFPCERYLRRHLLTHGAGLFVCKYCEKSFKTANYLKVHLIIHTGEKPFACKTCDAAFNRRDKLKRHELCHDPVKRYKCPMNNNGCKREFNRPDKLKAHILTHSGVKPYKCPLCLRSFTRRAHLREHSKTHQEFQIDSVSESKSSQQEKTEVIFKLAESITATKSKPVSQSPIKMVDKTNQIKPINDAIVMDKIKKEDFDDVLPFTQAKDFVCNRSDAMQTENDNESESLISQRIFNQSHLKQQSSPDSKIVANDQNSIILITTSGSSQNPSTISGSVRIDKPSNEAAQSTSSNVTSIVVGSNTSSALPATTTESNTLVSTAAITNSQKLPVTTGTTTIATSTVQNPFHTFILLYSCPSCEAYFFKEDEIKNHKCLVSNSNNNNATNFNDKNDSIVTKVCIQSVPNESLQNQSVSQTILVSVDNDQSNMDNNGNNIISGSNEDSANQVNSNTYVGSALPNLNQISVKSEDIF
ncbi:putative sodium-coupled neutral amino acid transporter 7 [Sarcoptes scabiei]|nr:putative sodium-coupled neutral amino acid transporter 7 [Sarcoptes scabiei]